MPPHPPPARAASLSATPTPGAAARDGAGRFLEAVSKGSGVPFALPHVTSVLVNAVQADMNAAIKSFVYGGRKAAVTPSPLPPRTPPPPSSSNSPMTVLVEITIDLGAISMSDATPTQKRSLVPDELRKQILRQTGAGLLPGQKAGSPTTPKTASACRVAGPTRSSRRRRRPATAAAPGSRPAPPGRRGVSARPRSPARVGGLTRRRPATHPRGARRGRHR